MRHLAISGLVCLSIMFGAASARAEFPEQGVYVGLSGGANLKLRNWDLGKRPAPQPQTSAIIDARIGFQPWRRWAFEVGLNVLPLKSTDGKANTTFAYNADALFHILPSDWTPYVLVGAGAYSNISGDLGSDTDFQFHFGGGLRGLITDWLALRVEARDVMSDGNDAAGSNNLAITAGLDVFLEGTRDRDGDGIADAADKCPDVKGVASANGCPDRDGDGTADALDKCPDVKGSKELDGCPDRDSDGITDAADQCPDERGVKELQGCPDRDGDGIADAADKCPDVKGLKELDGCPDKDGDGIADAADKCPDVKGLKAFDGCPDKDGDGIPDALDACPSTPGPKLTKGCPDKDNDGVVDNEDKCPDVAGLKQFQGCVPDAVKKFTGAIKGINFETGSAKITKGSYPTLNNAVEVLKKFTELKLRIEGHTDDVGDDASNLKLSQDRAASVRDYLTGKGIDAARLRPQGFGETKPVADNKTPKGRAENRRIEFSITAE